MQGAGLARGCRHRDGSITAQKLRTLCGVWFCQALQDFPQEKKYRNKRSVCLKCERVTVGLRNVALGSRVTRGDNHSPALCGQPRACKAPGLLNSRARMTASPGRCEGRRLWIFQGTLEAPGHPRLAWGGCGGVFARVPGSARCPRAGLALWGQGSPLWRGAAIRAGVTRWSRGRDDVQVRGSFRERCRKSCSRHFSAFRCPRISTGVLVALSGRSVVTLGVASDQSRCRRRQSGFGAAPCPFRSGVSAHRPLPAGPVWPWLLSGPARELLPAGLERNPPMGSEQGRCHRCHSLLLLQGVGTNSWSSHTPQGKTQSSGSSSCSSLSVSKWC